MVLINCLPQNEHSNRFIEDLEDKMQLHVSSDLAEFKKIDVNCVSRLKQTLEMVVRAYHQTTNPAGLILHLEAHGVRDFSDNLEDVGITVGNSHEVVSWSELQPYFSDLYSATGESLRFLFLRAGGYSAVAAISRSFSSVDCAPFRYLVSPTVKLTVGELTDFWKKFYDVVYNNGDLAMCFSGNKNFNITSIERFVEEYVLSDDYEKRGHKLQHQLLEKENLFKTKEELEAGYVKSTRSFVKRFLLVEMFPWLRTDLDLRRIAKKLNDYELMLETTKPDEWS